MTRAPRHRRPMFAGGGGSGGGGGGSPSACLVPQSHAARRPLLNEEQAAAARAPLEQALVVVAAAGTGKTTTMLERLSFMLEQVNAGTAMDTAVDVAGQRRWHELCCLPCLAAFETLPSLRNPSQPCALCPHPASLPGRTCLSHPGAHLLLQGARRVSGAPGGGGGRCRRVRVHLPHLVVGAGGWGTRSGGMWACSFGISAAWICTRWR